MLQIVQYFCSLFFDFALLFEKCGIALMELTVKVRIMRPEFFVLFIYPLSVVLALKNPLRQIAKIKYCLFVGANPFACLSILCIEFLGTGGGISDKNTVTGS